jgi:hypothetical protein
VVTAGERRVLQAARAFVHAGWGQHGGGGGAGKEAPLATKEERDSAWGLFE